MEHTGFPCEECYSVVASGADGLLRSSSIPRKRRPYWSQWRSIAAAAVIIVTLGIFATLSQRRPGLRTLANAAPPTRRVEARLTGFPYQPLESRTRGSDTALSERPDYWQFAEAAGRIRDAAERHPTRDTFHALGVARFVLGDSRGALVSFGEALRKETGDDQMLRAIDKAHDAALLSDLSAAALQASQVKDD